ncbi:hypothetical protein DTO271G3_898 [Paecilomyces variotii]|nr:hypothetical protein DTO271G3_898 [Paecilomyces variotii]
MFSAGGHQLPGQHYGGGHGRGRRRSFHVHNARHFGQDFGQGFEQEFTQEFSQDFGQGFGQHFGQGFGQHFGHGMGQQLGHGLGQGFGQDAYGFPMPQGYAYDDAHVRGYGRMRPRRGRRAQSVPPFGAGANPYIMPAGYPHGMIPGQYQTPMGQFVGQNQAGFASGTRLGGGRGRRRRPAYMEPYQEGGFSRSRRRR